jgi:hypothetical protein
MATIKDHARRLCAPLLNPLEAGDSPYHYAPKSRAILVIMSLLFIALASALGLLLPAGSDPFFILPVAVFGLLGALGLLVAWLGSERAVARLWNSRQG